MAKTTITIDEAFNRWGRPEKTPDEWTWTEDGKVVGVAYLDRNDGTGEPGPVHCMEARQ